MYVVTGVSFYLCLVHFSLSFKICLFFTFLLAYYYFSGQVKLALQQKHLCNLAMVMYLNVGRLDRYHATLFCAGLQVPDSRKTVVAGWESGEIVYFDAGGFLQLFEECIHDKSSWNNLTNGKISCDWSPCVKEIRKHNQAAWIKLCVKPEVKY